MADANPQQASVRTVYLTLAMIYPLFLFILFFVSSSSPEGMMPLSLGAFFQPYTGENAMVSSVLMVFGLFDLFYFNVCWLPKLLPNARSHLIALIMPEMFALFGFIIGIMNNNPWAAVPYVLVAFANYVWVYTKVTESTSSL